MNNLGRFLNELAIQDFFTLRNEGVTYTRKRETIVKLLHALDKTIKFTDEDYLSYREKVEQYHSLRIISTPNFDKDRLLECSRRIHELTPPGYLQEIK